jgi:DNA repair exonuclease SbcCD ATPase subunit
MSDMLTEQRLSSIEKDIAGIVVNQKNFDDLLEKMDKTLSRITDVSQSIAQMLAVHQNTIERQEKNIEKNEDDMRAIHVRLHEVKNDLRSEIQQEYGRIIKRLDDHIEENRQQHKSISDRFSKVEKFVWAVSGGGVIVGYLLSKILPIIAEKI